MSAATIRSAGVVSCSGRVIALPAHISLNVVSLPRAAPWLATKMHQRGSLLRSMGPDQFQSAPPLADESPESTTSAESTVSVCTWEVSGLINTSNFNAMAALASVGMIETAYLTYVKLFNGPLVCPTNGCESVLGSPYAQLYGMPLSLFGMLAYGAVGALAATYVQQAKANAPASVRETTLLGLTAGVAALATTSAVLIRCLGHLSCDPRDITHKQAAQGEWPGPPGQSVRVAEDDRTAGHDRQGGRENALSGVGGALATAAVLYGGLPKGSSAGTVYDENFFLPYRAPLVSGPSSDRAIDLARRLSAVGARMYGAFWCSHCLEQKEEFGGAAMAEFPYVECFPNGWKRGEKVAPACEAANVRAFPTWVIGGKTLEGELQLDEVEREVQRAEAAAATAATNNT
ncbi:hypothetical protein VOLCADRAFT_107426 [Volvox carteri f. nagariensis]|uniref:Vitamin K epoxide reductase domain-containing protein n=1 Tax=Volvox carteri f. nagariensis TaxID=3068 RepID=D8UDY9_VOLCA|nr:uncharacterized protein VOLCADRAFT_107426 [Volvox carteri f. nagariensis]EFJ41997.1 hypothetical protein VOLCADRAFT_107426 [Volvox carteri f. nagariensis]|eukprot:XP_002956872.1 hypothetical protein VOLCADRAFT_107426 [Volvox carteri f. nagariensis]